MVILAVDDEQMALDNLVQCISSCAPEAEIYGFRKIKDVLAFIEKTSCDVAFLDINMRGGNGISLAHILQEHMPRLNIIFTTGYTEYSVDAFNLHASGYILKPVTQAKIRHELNALRHPVNAAPKKRVRIRAFGNFEIYVDDIPIKFQYTKTKELIAYLVDRKGTTVSINELLSVLWEDEAHRSHTSYLKNMRSDLISTLTDLGCADILLRVRGGLAVLPDKVDCDYFDFLRGGKAVTPARSYNGEYMSQYSWAEYTHAILERNLISGFD